MSAGVEGAVGGSFAPYVLDIQWSQYRYGSAYCCDEVFSSGVDQHVSSGIYLSKQR